jgi:hypothetical protein
MPSVAYVAAGKMCRDFKFLFQSLCQTPIPQAYHRKVYHYYPGEVLHAIYAKV